jgi:Spy/CpxP family protein refolding chaperone
VQAQDTLNLTDAQFARVLPALKALQGARRRFLQSRRQLLNLMNGLLKSSPLDEAALRDRLAALKDLEAKSRDEIQRAYEALDGALEPMQQARFRLFEEQVERRKIELLMKARQRAAEQQGPAPRR